MPAAERLRLAVFDLDGTLIDSAASIVDGVRACWEACGFPDPDPAQVRRVIGLPWEESLQTLMPGSGARELAMIRAYHDEVNRGLRTRPPRSEALFPGAGEALAALEGTGFLLAIVTSRGSHRVHEILDEHGLARSFLSVKTVDHGPGKPNPYLLLEAMSEAGARGNETVMVGDTIFDVAMARNAGTAAIGVSWGVHEVHELVSAGAHHVAERFEEIPPLAHALTGEG